MPLKELGKDRQFISDAQRVEGSVFDSWKDWAVRQTAGDPFGGLATMLPQGAFSPKQIFNVPHGTPGLRGAPSWKQQIENPILNQIYQPGNPPAPFVEKLAGSSIPIETGELSRDALSQGFRREGPPPGRQADATVFDLLNMLKQAFMLSGRN